MGVQSMWKPSSSQWGLLSSSHSEKEKLEATQFAFRKHKHFRLLHYTWFVPAAQILQLQSDCRMNRRMQLGHPVKYGMALNGSVKDATGNFESWRQ